MATVSEFISLVKANGSNVVYHKDDATTACPCRTPEGFRDPLWHKDNPDEPVCNAAGYLTNSGLVEISVKAFMQPIQSTRATRLQSEMIETMFGIVEADDHLGIFPLEWGNVVLEFHDWGTSTEDWLEYDGRRFQVVNANKIADPDGGLPHHWEIGARLIHG